MYGKTLLIGESCWWGSCNDSVKPYATDRKYVLKNWRDVYELTCEHALNYGFNTLDLRELPETEGWIVKAGDLVRKFISKGGYRLCPYVITVPVKVQVGEEARIEHCWKNLATGYLPNNVKNWNNKYKPALALLNDRGEVVKVFVDRNADPSSWLYKSENIYSFPIGFDGVTSGTYRWAVSIVDVSKGNIPGIRLAINVDSVVNGWYIIGQVVVS